MRDPHYQDNSTVEVEIESEDIVNVDTMIGKSLQLVSDLTH